MLLVPLLAAIALIAIPGDTRVERYIALGATVVTAALAVVVVVTRRRDGVRVQRPGFAGGLQLLEEVVQREHVIELVRQGQVGVAGQRHLGRQHQGIQPRCAQVILNGAQPLGTLRMPPAHVVCQTVRM